MVRTALAGVAALATASSASAALLNLVRTTPDVASGFVSIDYDASTHLFTASGFTQNVDMPPQQAAGQRQFSLSLFIDNDGTVLPLPASLVVRGDIGGIDQVLYQSTQLAPNDFFGSGATDRFEFVFVQQSGSLAPAGTLIGTILSANMGTFPSGVPSFTSSFSNHSGPIPGNGAADTFPIPAPGAATLLAAGTVVCFRRRRR